MTIEQNITCLLTEHKKRRAVKLRWWKDDDHSKGKAQRHTVYT